MKMKDLYMTPEAEVLTFRAAERLALEDMTSVEGGLDVPGFGSGGEEEE